MGWKDSLEGQALEIASSKSKRLRVMAGPGTGKSFAMKRRIMRLLEEENVAPEKILAVTFTRTAASDLKKRIAAGIFRSQKNSCYDFTFILLLVVKSTRHL